MSRLKELSIALSVNESSVPILLPFLCLLLQCATSTADGVTLCASRMQLSVVMLYPDLPWYLWPCEIATDQLLDQWPSAGCSTNCQPDVTGNICLSLIGGSIHRRSPYLEWGFIMILHKKPLQLLYSHDII